MKKTIFVVLAVACVLLVLGLNSCKNPVIPDGRFIGTWISTDNADTLCFENDTKFVRLRSTGYYDYFNYNYTNDSITITYSGPLKIMVRPTTHRYTIRNGNLMIDFTNECFGFEKRVMNYKRKI